MRSCAPLAFVVLALPGCSPEAAEDLGRADDAIKDGFADSDDTAVVAVVNAGMGGLCTGSLIAPNVVLTARHCVSATSEGNVDCATTAFGAVAAAEGFFISTAPAVTPANAGEYTAALVVGLAGVPGIPGSVPDDRLLCGQDLAIIILAQNIAPEVATPFVPGVDAPPAEGTAYHAVGYGAVDGMGSDAGTRRRRDDLALVCYGASGCDQFPSGIEAGEWIGAGGVCSGDSGGPAIDEMERVIGVTSRGDSECEVSLYGDPAAHGQWIKDSVVYASGMGLYTAPAWTEGATVDPAHSLPIGTTCASGADCPSGICIQDGQHSYCSRSCTEDGPCPAEFDCTDAQCVLKPDAFPPPFQRAPKDDGCSHGGGQGGAPWPWLALLGLGLVRVRRFGWLAALLALGGCSVATAPTGARPRPAPRAVAPPPTSPTQVASAVEPEPARGAAPGSQPAPDPAPDVAYGTAKRLTGPLTEARIREVVRASFDKLGACYAKGLRRDKKLAGTIEVFLAIGDNGEVVSAEAPKGKTAKRTKTAAGAQRILDEEVVGCVEQHFMALKFPPTGRGLVNLIYPVVFHVE